MLCLKIVKLQFVIFNLIYLFQLINLLIILFNLLTFTILYIVSTTVANDQIQSFKIKEKTACCTNVLTSLY